MEIGGIDVIIPRTRGSIGECILEVINCWPNARYERGKDEAFIYRDEQAEKSWEDDTGELHSIIYLIFDANVVTVVVDDPNEPATKIILDRIRTVIS